MVDGMVDAQERGVGAMVAGKVSGYENGTAGRRPSRFRGPAEWLAAWHCEPLRQQAAGMHWGTFNRLTAEHDALVGVSLAGTAVRLGLIERRLDGVGNALHREG